MNQGTVSSMERLMEKVPSVYKLVNLAARRALEVADGSPRLVEGSAKEKAAITALREIAAGKVGFRPKKPVAG